MNNDVNVTKTQKNLKKLKKYYMKNSSKMMFVLLKCEF